MVETGWTPAMVEACLEEAADVLRRLPEERVQGYFNAWPPIVREYWESFGWNETVLRRPRPSPASITRMDRALDWLRWLDADDGRLVWMRAERTPWKGICWRLGISRATANRRMQYALCLIALRLNGKRVPRKRSRQFVVERVRSASSPN